jgi:hypothetical protein
MSINQDKVNECVNRLDHLALRVGQAREKLTNQQIQLLSQAIDFLSQTMDYVDELGEIKLNQSDPVRLTLPKEEWERQRVELAQPTQQDFVTEKLTKIRERLTHGR